MGSRLEAAHRGLGALASEDDADWTPHRRSRRRRAAAFLLRQMVAAADEARWMPLVPSLLYPAIALQYSRDLGA